MTRLEVLPAVTSHHALQHCWIGRQLFRSIGAKFGKNAVISVGTSKYLCQLWPRDDRVEGYIQLNNSMCELTNEMGSTIGTESIPVESIMLQTVETVKWIKLTVVLSDNNKVSQYKSDSSWKYLEKHVQKLLQGVSFKENFCLQCGNTPLGTLYGIAYVVFNSLPKNTQCGRLKPSSKITIENIISHSRFHQKHFERRPVIAVGGFDRLVSELKEFVEVPFVREKQLESLGANCARGCILYGPSGSGKTSLVRHVAAITGAYVITVHGAEVLNSLPGETESNLQKLFQKAHHMGMEGPCILFLDEVDSLAGSTGKGSSSMSRRTLTQLLSLMDELTSSGGYQVVIAATNCIDAIDRQLRQGGRLEKEILVGVPTYDQRQGVLSALTDGLPLCSSLSLSDVAEKTPGYLPADLASLVQHATQRAHTQQTKTLTAADFAAALHYVSPSTQRGSDVVAQHKPVSWDDIGGLENVKLQLQQAVEWPLKHPGAFTRLSIPRPKGVLLKGPPGCAKTLLVRAAASACHVTFLAVSGAQLYSPYVGETERKISQVFRQARAGAPAILFIDEIDCVVGKRGQQQDKQGGVQERVLSTLLNEMDGIGSKLTEQTQQGEKRKIAEGDAASHAAAGSKVDSPPVDNSGVIVVAATNRPDMLDDAILRPGRIDRIVEVPLPDLQTRQKILEVHTKKMPLENVELAQIASQTTGFSGADLENLCREAALRAMSEDGVLEARSVQQHHMDQSLATARKQTTRSPHFSFNAISVQA